MARVRVKMLTTYAGPDTVLDAGRVYVLDGEFADRLLAAGSGNDGKPAAVKVTGGTASPVTAPDPGDKPHDPSEDDE